MKKLFSFSLFSIFLFTFLSLGTISTLAADFPTPLEGLNDTAQVVEPYKGQKNTVYNSDFINKGLGEMIGIVLSFVGVLFLALIVFAGVSWMTAGGNDQKIEKAKSLIINAAIGLLIVLSAYAITSFIGSKLT